MQRIPFNTSTQSRFSRSCIEQMFQKQDEFKSYEKKKIADSRYFQQLKSYQKQYSTAHSASLL